MSLEHQRPSAAVSSSTRGEMSLAGDVQRLLLPKSSPLCSWCCMGAKNRMASVLGGDFYDFIALEDGCQALFVGDVTGHDVHASVVMALVYGFLHRATQEGCDPCKVVTDLNAFLRHFATRSQRLDHFFSATLFFGVIEPGSLRMNYINAGHPAGMVRRGNQTFRLPATSHPIGYFDRPDYPSKSFELVANDRLLLFTDGIIDSMNPAGERYGMPRLENFLSDHTEDHLSFLEGLFADLDGFLAGHSAFDDLTAIVIDFHQPRQH